MRKIEKESEREVERNERKRIRKLKEEEKGKKMITFK